MDKPNPPYPTVLVEYWVVPQAPGAAYRYSYHVRFLRISGEPTERGGAGTRTTEPPSLEAAMEDARELAVSLFENAPDLRGWQVIYRPLGHEAQSINGVSFSVDNQERKRAP